MRPTRLWRAIAAIAGGLLLAGAITVRLTPAAIGLVGMVYLAHTRWAAREAFDEARVRVTREVPAEAIHRDAPVEVHLDAERSHLPYGVHLRVDDDVPEAFEIVDGEPRLRGATRRRYGVEPTATGSFAFERVHVRLEDARGLWRHETTLPTRTEVRVLPSRRRLIAGRRLAKRSPMDATAQDARGTIVKELEFDAIRPAQPGDRLRDVDWKRFAQFDELMTRQFEKETEAPVVFLVDAGRTMRQADREGDSKLDFAAEIVLELAESASAHGNAVGLVAFDELRVLASQRPSERREAPTRLAEIVSDLPRRVAARRRLDVGLPERRPVDEAELDLLEQLAVLQGEGARSSSTGTSSPSSPSPSSSPSSSSSSSSPSSSPSSSSPSSPSSSSSPSTSPSVASSGATPGSTVSAPGFRRAVQQVLASSGGSRKAVVAMTDLEGFPDEAVRLLGRLASRGHRVVVGILPGTWFLDPPERIRARDMENAYKEIETRRQTRRYLEGRGITVVELGPWSGAAVIAEETHASSSTRARGTGSTHTGPGASRKGTSKRSDGDDENDGNDGNDGQTREQDPEHEGGGSEGSP